MAANEFSRHIRTEVYEDQSSPRRRTLRTLRIPFSYREHPGNSIHVVREGETVFSVSFKMYSELGLSIPKYSSARLYYAIADFQPTPIVDPTIQLRPGFRLVIPSVELVTTEIIGG